MNVDDKERESNNMRKETEGKDEEAADKHVNQSLANKFVTTSELSVAHLVRFVVESVHPDSSL